jgi:hypothetical protein
MVARQPHPSRARAKKTATALNWITGIASVWAWFYPVPYKIVIALLVALPLAAISLLVQSKGVYQMEGSRRDSRPSLAAPFMFPLLILAMRDIQDIHLFQWKPLLLAAIITSLALLLIIGTADRSLRNRPWTILILFIFGAVYTGATITQANSIFDRSSPQTFAVSVLGRHISSGGKSTSYYIRVAPWGPSAEPGDIYVPRYIYRSVQPGQSIWINLYPGALRLPWYSLSVPQYKPTQSSQLPNQAP